MTKYVFASVFSDEMNGYLKYLSKLGRYIDGIKSTLTNFDKYLVNINLSQKFLSEQMISDWQKNRNVSSNTKWGDISDIKGFANYLASLRICASYPEAPKKHLEYAPYIFSDKELEQIFEVADNFRNKANPTRADFVFPILLRILYGCGLRLNEGCSLRWKNIDFDKGILIIEEAKNLKQRLVPMDISLIQIIEKYKKMVLNKKICSDYLFESKRNAGNPFVGSAFYRWFMKVLHNTDIKYIKLTRHERGPCPHCFRHIFTHKSFIKSENNGERFENYAPFLAAYLGHSSPRETEEYLCSNYSVYTYSHKRVSAEIGNLFPEVCFDEE